MTQRYYALLRRKVEELHITYLQFFETAHLWRFQRQSAVATDYCEFLQNAVVAKYVQEFLDHLGESDACHQVLPLLTDGADRKHGEVLPSSHE